MKGISNVFSFILVKSDGSFNIDAISQLASALISPKNANIQAIRLLFGTRLSPDELRQQLKNPNSLLHRATSEIVMMFYKYTLALDEIAYNRFREEFRRTLIRDKIRRFRNLLKRSVRLRYLLKRFNWNRARQFLLLSAAKKENYVQNLLRQNLLELNYLLSLDIDEKSKQQILDSIIQRNEIMEQEARIIDQLNRRLDSDDLSPEDRKEILKQLARHQRHVELSSLENKLKFMGDFIHNRERVVQTVRMHSMVEKIHLLITKTAQENIATNKSASSSYCNILRHQHKKDNHLFAELNRNLAIALDLYTEKYSDEPPFLISINEVLTDILNFTKTPNDLLKEKIGKNLELIAETLPKDPKFKDFLGSLRRAYREKVIPLKQSSLSFDEGSRKKPTDEKHIPSKNDLLVIVSSHRLIKSYDDINLDLPRTILDKFSSLSNLLEKLEVGEVLENKKSEAYRELVDHFNFIVQNYSEFPGLYDLYDNFKVLSLIDTTNLYEPIVHNIMSPNAGPSYDI